MNNYNIAVIPGDGVGTEVSAEATRMLQAAADKFAFKTEFENFDWGCDYYLEHGQMGQDNLLDVLKGFDSIFLGCIGDA